VSRSSDQFEEIEAICAGTKTLTDGPLHLIHFPALSIPTQGRVERMEALLCLTGHEGYSTRLFLERLLTIPSRNWKRVSLVGREWHTWSWNNVPGDLRIAQILAEHLRALR
jgi:hypothetical protein